MKYFFLFTFIGLLISCNDSNTKQEAKVTPKKEVVQSNKLFALKTSKETGLGFRNTVKETLEENYLNYEFLYNGSGVAVGDINNDGLPDIYFAGNSADDKLYLNEGDLKFKDISVSSGISASKGWSTGVTMVDINTDGWLDIYVCRSGPSKDVSKRTNKLYVNNQNGTFTEASAQYGLQSTAYSIQSAFFDYDLDGDLDMYLLNHPDPKFKAKNAIDHMKEIKSGKIKTDAFYENQDGTYVEKSKEANLVNFGYRHGIAIGDINKDGYPDVYISSDFEEPDVLSINQGDGTFKNEIDSYLEHISFNSMGNEMVDINNDGLLDIFVVDMAPSDHFRSKAYMASMDVGKFRRLQDNGYHTQYMFNTMHLNNGADAYSEVAQYSGVAKTDWSWAPLFFDMDHDGYKDLFITNGIKENFLFRDIQKEVDKKKNAGGTIGLNDLLQIVPSDISENLFYHNKDGHKFENVSGDWAGVSLYNSNGVATADFDNDGDLDFVTNNMDAAATLYESKAQDLKKGNSVKLIINGSDKNPRAIGAKIEIETSNGPQWQELYTTRGYLSSVDTPLVFGIASDEKVTAHITWPTGERTTLEGLAANTTHEVDFNSATKQSQQPTTKKPTLFSSLKSTGVTFGHKEDAHDEYVEQILLPHSQSTVGPFTVTADVNKDGREDMFIGGAAGQAGVLYLQNASGRFAKTNGPWAQDANAEDTGALFFDADGDGDQDLYVVSGGAHHAEGNANYQDRLYLNNGSGRFSKSANALPANTVSGQAVASSDVDGDGDLDLFVGGRIIPDKYPYPPKSYLLINDSGTFTEKAISVNHLVSGALFSDYDGDGDEDLLTAGEWSAIQVFENTNGEFNKKDVPSLQNTTGLWFSLSQSDIDNDGDMDYIAGNIGLNTKFKANDKKKFHIYCDDFDANGTYDVVLSSNYNGRLVPARGRECSSQQMPFIKDKFTDFTSFANASLEDIYGDKLSQALHYEANMLQSIFIENNGNGTFTIKELPWVAQLSPLSGVAFVDVTGNGTKEVITVGNLYNVEVETVRYDASKGSVLQYVDGDFVPMDVTETGFYTTGDARKVSVIDQGTKKMVVVTYNNGRPEVFSVPSKTEPGV